MPYPKELKRKIILIGSSLPLHELIDWLQILVSQHVIATSVKGLHYKLIAFLCKFPRAHLQHEFPLSISINLELLKLQLVVIDILVHLCHSEALFIEVLSISLFDLLQVKMMRAIHEIGLVECTGVCESLVSFKLIIRVVEGIKHVIHVLIIFRLFIFYLCIKKSWVVFLPDLIFFFFLLFFCCCSWGLMRGGVFYRLIMMVWCARMSVFCSFSFFFGILLWVFRELAKSFFLKELWFFFLSCKLLFHLFDKITCWKSFTSHLKCRWVSRMPTIWLVFITAISTSTNVWEISDFINLILQCAFWMGVWFEVLNSRFKLLSCYFGCSAELIFFTSNSLWNFLRLNRCFWFLNFNP